LGIYLNKKRKILPPKNNGKKRLTGNESKIKKGIKLPDKS